MVEGEEAEKDTKKILKNNGSGNDDACNNVLRANKLIKGRIYLSEHFKYNGTKEDIGGPYASMTLPIKFKRYNNGSDTSKQKKNKNKSNSYYLPKAGRIPPKDVLWPLDGGIGEE